MNIRHAMLGLLQAKPMTGYELKKEMLHSPIMHWSGNNSQIYRALAELEGDGLATVEVLHEQASPTRKVYSLTMSGRAELRRLSLGFPEIPEIRKPFLMQLVFGGQFARPDLERLLNEYGGEVRGAMLLIQDEDGGDGSFESVIRALAIENVRQTYQAELDWIEMVRAAALPLAAQIIMPQEDEEALQTVAASAGGLEYMRVVGGRVRQERDGLALIAACAENGVNRLLLPRHSLSAEAAGAVVHKLASYNIKASAVSDDARLPEPLRDADCGRMFRAFASEEEAIRWLVGEGENDA